MSNRRSNRQRREVLVIENEVSLACQNLLSGYLGQKAGDRLVVFTDTGRSWLACIIARAGTRMGLDVRVQLLEPQLSRAEVENMLAAVDEGEAVLSALSFAPDPPPWARLFPALSSPPGFKGRSAAIRSRLPGRALLAMLSSDPVAVHHRVQELLAYSGSGRLEVTAPGGTAIKLQPRDFRVLPWRLDTSTRHAFLPPSEVYTALVEGSAHGTIAVDITAGECVAGGELLDELGLVDRPVLLTVEEGMVTSIEGGDTACRLRACLENLPSSCRLVVELGLGLSQGFPTGHISADECLAGTCHFGLGDNLFFGGVNEAPVHLDLVVSSPTLRVLD